ncbi:DNA-binding protein [Mesorhizobium sp. M00.F.Ca.ET.151.01.1.1]|nr:DNA-binding protein [bacterium M00.F.Ca.ET.199.01.1.1]TGT02998.1 DNA-binding protein [bacterium M00.F.Ca.ET.177.01.1.1]TGT57934.1 DNA-binding protein [Mesorhizobium sp. M00.F.Ca.ET.170.01.1.1]TGU06847.1 DNA-binding protein [bacterium M00.F.Ca.ET.163.01.1.1]TGU91548.1 DNA-binding protein [Mesorhizobium sp. M00.F.Ca.ET.151.01.1.1]TGV53236.1 DNA-binding protein [bacterium M00.F.Ca.ET.141.01.1.1]
MKAKNSISPCTGEQARLELGARGESVAAFARRHGLSVSTVHQVLGGRSKAKRGEAHRAAVLLGMKIGTIKDNA